MDNILIFPPLEGEWKFLRPPGHHPYAFDFVRLDEKRKSTHTSTGLRFIVGSIPASNYFCWGMPVYAPIDGRVVRVGDGWNDHESTNIWKTIQLWFNATFRFRPKIVNGRLDIRPNAGNHVMIEAREGYIVFLAHLRNRSIVISEGSLVKRGDLIGKIGNSGNSTMPHLHINLFDQIADPYSANVLPFVFNKYELLVKEGSWVVQQSSRPSPGAVIKFHA
jgi:hypothetical protein